MIEGIRFRAEGALLVLQVQLRKNRRGGYDDGQWSDDHEWRDAKVEDLLHVAAYTRAHDSLTSTIESLRGQVLQVQDQMSEGTDRRMRAFAAEAGPVGPIYG